MSAARLLVVDDDEQGRILLHDLLESVGHEVQVAGSGREALEIIQNEPPDAVLLDVMMPGLSGYEVTKLLKDNPETSHIHVLLVTALTDREAMLRGIECGADDFLTKPIDGKEVILRVRNAVHAKRLFDQVQRDFKKLRELEALRDNLTHMIMHDMKSPLMNIVGNLELLSLSQDEWINNDDADSLNAAKAGSEELIRMINSLLDVSRMEEGELKPKKERCDLSWLIKDVIESRTQAPTDASVEIAVPDEPVIVSCDLEMIRRTMLNMIGNALKYTPESKQVRVSIESEPDCVRVAVEDKGPGIAEEYHEKLFEKFGQVDIRESGIARPAGLGLTFCKAAVVEHGGSMGLESELKKGSKFWFTLPLAVAESGGVDE